MTRSALFKREGDNWEAVQIPALRVPQYYDVATEPNGVFWLATTEGLVRHSLQSWRVPPGLAALKTAVHAILEDKSGGLWFASKWSGTQTVEQTLGGGNLVVH